MATEPTRRFKSEKRRKLVDWAGYAALGLFVGPFALLYLSALLGISIMEVPGFAFWFMAVLSIGAGFCLFEVVTEGVRTRPVPFFWIIAFGGMAYLCGSYIYKTLSDWLLS